MVKITEYLPATGQYAAVSLVDRVLDHGKDYILGIDSPEATNIPQIPGNKIRVVLYDI